MERNLAPSPIRPPRGQAHGDSRNLRRRGGGGLADRETTYHSELRPSRLVVLGRTGAGRRLKVVVEVADENYVWTVAGRDEED